MRHQEAFGKSTIKAEICLGLGSTQVWDFDLAQASHRVLREENILRLDLSLDRRLPGTGLCFANRWSAHRYEAPGRLFVLPPGETLRVRSGIGRQRAIICRLPTSSMEAWVGGMADWPARRLEASIDIRNVRICNLLMRLAEEAEYPGFAGVAMAEGLAMQIAVTLERHLRDLADPAPEGGLAAWRLRLIDDRLRDVTEAPGLTELALLCRLSVRQLSRGFRASRGLSIGAYVAERRAEGAKRLLTGGASVKEVAFALGFNSPSSFCVAFKKATGITPSHYRLGS